MKVYQVTHYDDQEGWFKKSYHSSEAAAARAKKMEGIPKMNIVTVLEINPTKLGIIQFLNLHASYPDNG